MFTIDERIQLQERLLERAAQDVAVVGVAFTGSQATASGDRWSDTDLAQHPDRTRLAPCSARLDLPSA